MTSMDLGFLPKIKCSNCGQNVEISAMGDHVCTPSEQKTPVTAMGSPPSNMISPKTSNATSDATRLPSPPPSAGLETPDHLKVVIGSRSSRLGAPPRIDPSIANRPFLQSTLTTPASSTGSHLPSPLSIHDAPRSPMSQSVESNPRSSPEDEPTLDQDTVFSFPMPGSRPPALVGTPSLKNDISLRTSARIASAPSPRPGLNVVPENVQLPPSPLPPQAELGQQGHGRGESIASQSSYRSSLGSTRHGESTTRSSASRSSTQSISRGLRSFINDTPPLPPAPLRTPNQASLGNDSKSEINRTPIARSERGNSYSGFDFGIDPSTVRPTQLEPSLKKHEQTEVTKQSRQHTSLSSSHSTNRLDLADTELNINANFPRKASEATSESATSITEFARAMGFDDPSGFTREESTASEYESSGARTGSSSGSSMSSLPSDTSLNREKNSDPLNLSSLVEDLPARTRQTIVEMPGRPRDTLDEIPRIPAVFFSPDSPTDPAIGQGSLSLIDEKREGSLLSQQSGIQKLAEQPSQLPSPSPTQAPRSIKPPQATEAFCQLPSTEPLPNHEAKPQSSQNEFHEPVPHFRPMQRSATEPISRPPTRSGARPKGDCKGCGEPITGKSISSSDGRLTGRYHRGCFVCFDCHSPFPSAEFYVLNNRPYCAQHYHERNGSLCSTCHHGIEGQYLETVEHNGSRLERRRFHPECLQCRTCRVLLKGDYFEWNGEVYCEQDARRAANSYYRPPPGHSGPMGPPHGGGPGAPGSLRPPGPPGPGARRRSPGGPPLAPNGRPYPPPPAGYRPPPSPTPSNGGLRPGPRYSSGGARRFPERRTTKLMMT
ncbi:hypothetical protein N7539_006052 [Penicillium diatomitis]|uniref:LIM zinc-binding domain-containing protein n=1 Tax=Penicillium diatomitis TaxID=2819901 RepID=A0A9W9X4L8_9EURO|nr:uncharacterized protein N7539_006052 [Penicillium diatomitis]KAJ5483852.1 hypothetical protein N7539_006052 [Penicillium diatomitis]